MKANKGITLIPLIILIIIMLILLGVLVIPSRDILEKSKGEKLLTYMELIKLRANAYYEDICFEFGNEAFESYIVVSKGEILIDTDANLANILKVEKSAFEQADEYNCYIKWDADKLAKQGIDKTFLENDEFFIVAYNYNTCEVEDVYYNKGIYLNGSEDPFYSMSELEREIGK